MGDISDLGRHEPTPHYIYIYIYIYIGTSPAGGVSKAISGGDRSALSTRWSTTLSSKVNLPHAIDFRALCGTVTSKLTRSTKASNSTVWQGAMGATRSKPPTPILLSWPRLPWNEFRCEQWLQRHPEAGSSW